MLLSTMSFIHVLVSLPMGKTSASMKKESTD
jgi:hypothetical protein